MQDVFVTVDTNLYDDQQIIDLGRGLPYLHIYSTKVTEGELGKEVVMGYQLAPLMYGESMWDMPEFVPNSATPSVLMFDYSLFDGNDVFASDRLEGTLLTDTLKIATNGSFKFPEDISSTLSGKQRQFNDARILEAHVNRGFHILVSNDVRFFGRRGSGLRRKLETRSNTRIMTKEEFINEYGSQINPPMKYEK